MIYQTKMINNNQLTDEAFISNVWKWKYAGVIVWVSVSYAIYLLYAEFLRYYFHQKYTNMSLLFPIVFITASFPLYFYNLSLTVIPIRKNVLTWREYKKPLLFYLTQYFWIFFHLSMYISNIQFNLALSLFIIISLLLYLDFTIILVNFVSSNNRKPFESRFSIFKEYCIFSVPIFPLIISFSYFYFKNQLYTGLIVTSTIYISFLFPSICSLVAGEKTSFSRTDNASRLQSGLKYTKSEIVKYWAYSDLLEILTNDYQKSNDDESTLNTSNSTNSSPRSFIFTNKSNIGEIIIIITDMINNMAEKHNNIGSPKADKLKVQSVDQKANLLMKIKRTYLNIKYYFTGRDGRTTNMMSERNAVTNSIIAIMGIESLVQLVLIAEKEDPNGEIQQYAETILNSITNLYRACDKSQQLDWNTPPFGKPWIVSDYQKLTIEVLHTTYRAIVNLVVRLGYRFDMTKINKDNAEKIQGFMKYGPKLFEDN